MPDLIDPLLRPVHLLVPSLLLLPLLLGAAHPASAQANHATGKPVTASSARIDYPAGNANDGILSDPSRWLADAAPTGHWLEIDLGGPTTLVQGHVHSGYATEVGSPADTFALESWDGANWQPVPGAAITGNTSFAVAFHFNPPVTTTGIRLSIADTSIIRVREIALWDQPSPLFAGLTGDQVPAWFPAYQNHALGRPVSHAGRIWPGYAARFANDGIAGDSSRFLARPELDPPNELWLEVDLGTPVVVAEAHVHSGFEDASADPDFHLEWWDGSTWSTIPGSVTTGNAETVARVTFTDPVTTDRVRYLRDNAGTGGYTRLRELCLFSQAGVPPGIGLLTGGPGVIEVPTPVALNQIGFQTGAPKRFTAITCPDGTAFHISPGDAATVLFGGTISGGAGDFSDFEPGAPGPYLVHVTPAGQAAGESDPFLILDDLVGDKYLGPAVDFMNDARSAVGSHPSAFGGAPWRDGTYYSFEIPSLVHLLLTRRDAVLAMPRGIDWQAEKATVLDPAFDSVYQSKTASEGFLEALRRYYSNYEAPRSHAPDLVKIIHFGLGVTLERPDTRDWSGDERPRQVHAQTVEWCAWFLYAWPVLREWIPDSFHAAVHDFAFAEWGLSSGLGTPELTDDDPSSLEIDPLWDPATYGTVDKSPFKGRHAPAHSIWPNLLMHEVALREGRPDAGIYLAAAQTQARWLIDHLDWADPRTTKGHRMSECKTMPGLAFFLLRFPADAPAGLAAKIESWADTMIARSANGYDFRRYDDTEWSIPALANNWNEPGNLGGFPACALAAAWTLDHAPAKQQRLREISWAAIDCLFGRNPLRAASPGRPLTLANGNPAGFPDVERGWPKLYTGSAAYLENARGALCSGPGSGHFPNNPNAALRWHEPWTNFNAAWNLSLAYLAADLDGSHDTHSVPSGFSGDPDADSNHDGVPDLIHHASTGLGHPFERPVLAFGPSGPSLAVRHNLQAYDAELTVEWSLTLAPGSWQPATSEPTADIPHQDGTVTRLWRLPDEPTLFYRLRATR